MPKLGDILNSINLIKDADLIDQYNKTDYVPFLINRGMSFYPETILHANEMNRAGIDNKLQYHYLLNTVRPGKRFAKWVKRENLEDLECVKEYYGYSTDKALQALTILTSDNIHHIKQKLQRGVVDETRVASRGKTENG